MAFPSFIPKSSGSPGSVIPQGYKDYLTEFSQLLQAPQVSYKGATKEELAAALRPQYDLAIGERKEQTNANKANLDVDASARGMGASTWLSDVKNRQQNAEASDIASLEASYAKQLQDELQQEKANKLAADQYNASSQAATLQNALSLAGSFYSQAAGSGKGGKTGNKEDPVLLKALQDAALKNGTVSQPSAQPYTDWTALLKSSTPEQRKEILYGTSQQGKQYQQQIVADLGETALGRYKRTYG